jgi:hypothetical protein
MDKEMFEEMIRDWQADNAPEYDDLEIEEIKVENGELVAIAHDGKSDYRLSDDGTGNIVINYLSTGWGGSRKGAGRPATGRKLQRIYATDEEMVEIRKYLEELRK